MTKLEALRLVVSAPRDHAHQGRIGRRVIHEKADDAKVRIVRGWRQGISEWKRRHSA